MKFYNFEYVVRLHAFIIVQNVIQLTYLGQYLLKIYVLQK